MTSVEIFDIRGNQHMAAMADRFSAERAQRDAAVRGYWYIDRKTGKKLAGPFKDDDAAMSFRKNRPDRVPADAKLVLL